MEEIPSYGTYFLAPEMKDENHIEIIEFVEYLCIYLYFFFGTYLTVSGKKTKMTQNNGVRKTRF